MPLHVSSTIVLIVRRAKLYYTASGIITPIGGRPVCRTQPMHGTATYRCDDTRDCIVQDGAEPTDTFQMVIDNIWIQGKICETVYKYVQVCYLLPTNYKLIF